MVAKEGKFLLGAPSEECHPITKELQTCKEVMTPEGLGSPFIKHPHTITKQEKDLTLK